MSVDLLVTMLDLDRLQAAYGSQDDDLLSSIVAANQQAIAHHDQDFCDWVAEGHYSSIEIAIEQIIQGTVDGHLEPLFQFEHAVAMIADSIGECLESSVLMEAKEDFWDEVNLVIRKFRSARQLPAGVWPTLDDVLKRGPLLDIPLDRVRLGSGYLTASEVQRADDALLDEVAVGHAARDALRWPAQAIEAVTAYRGWIRSAADKRLGLFFHR